MAHFSTCYPDVSPPKATVFFMWQEAQWRLRHRSLPCWPLLRTSIRVHFPFLPSLGTQTVIVLAIILPTATVRSLCAPRPHPPHFRSNRPPSPQSHRWRVHAYPFFPQHRCVLASPRLIAWLPHLVPSPSRPLASTSRYPHVPLSLLVLISGSSPVSSPTPHLVTQPSCPSSRQLSP